MKSLLLIGAMTTATLFATAATASAHPRTVVSVRHDSGRFVYRSGGYYHRGYYGGGYYYGRGGFYGRPVDPWFDGGFYGRGCGPAGGFYYGSPRVRIGVGW
jgi:hypothetical protein